EVAGASRRVLPGEKEPLPLRVASYVPSERRDRGSHLAPRASEAPPDLSEATVTVFVALWLHLGSDNLHRRWVPLRLLQRREPEVDDEAPRTLLWILGDVVADEVWPHDPDIVSIASSEQLLCDSTLHEKVSDRYRTLERAPEVRLQ